MLLMFRGCTKLKNLDLSELDTSNVTNMKWMFYGCNYLNGAITVKGNVTSYDNIFTNSAIQPNCTFTVNYTSSTSNIVDNIINTKSSNSNVVKGTQVE